MTIRVNGRSPALPAAKALTSGLLARDFDTFDEDAQRAIPWPRPRF